MSKKSGGIREEKVKRRRLGSRKENEMVGIGGRASELKGDRRGSKAEGRGRCGGEEGRAARGGSGQADEVMNRGGETIKEMGCSEEAVRKREG